MNEDLRKTQPWPEVEDVTPREPDRFDAQAREIVAAFIRREDLGMITDVEPFIAAALRAEHASALERAARVADEYDNEEGHPSPQARALIRIVAERIRALIPPAAAPAAEPERPCTCGSRDDVHVMTCAKVAWLNSPPTGPFPPAPAAERNTPENYSGWHGVAAPAQGAEALNLQDYDFALGQLRHLYRQMVNGNVTHTDEAARGLLGPSIARFEGYRLLIASRAAPPKEPPAP